MSFHSWTRRSVLLGLTGLAMMVSIPTVGAQGQINQDVDRRNSIEKKLTHWKPTKDNDALPVKQLACVVQDMSGVWRTFSREWDSSLEAKIFPEGLRENDLLLGSSQIKLFSMGGNRYRVLFSTGGVSGFWSLERTATYSKGVLVLNRPVQEERDASYTRLFTIRTSKGIYLISDYALTTYYQKHEKEQFLLLAGFRNGTRIMKEKSDSQSKTAPSLRKVSPDSKPL